MGRSKYIKEFIERFKDRPYFSVREAKLFLLTRGSDEVYARLLLRNLEKTGRIKRIKRGYYSFKDDIDVIGFLFEPFYYGLQDALYIHRLWDQATNPVIITVRKVRTGVRQFLGRNVVIHHINRRMFFGYELIKFYDKIVPVSDIEKTLIDFVYFKVRLSEDLLDKVRKKIDKEKLNSYLKRYPVSFQKKVNKLIMSPEER